MAERITSGFTEVDAVPELRLIKPSCVYFQGTWDWDQLSLLYQLIHHFLKRGERGLYLCVNRPADEIRNSFNKMGVDIKQYDENYGLFFIDLFTESQEAYFENSTVDNLGYTPSKLIQTIGSFLDWIRNGFIVIDSISTLSLNMNQKEIYELLRGLKLIGRAFNLIIFGMGSPIGDAQLSENIGSCADSHLIFKDRTLVVSRFHEVASQGAVLDIAYTEEGKPTLIPLGTRLQARTNILNLVGKEGALTVRPTLTIETTPRIDLSGEELARQLGKLLQTGRLQATPICTTLTCPKCGHRIVHLYLECPQCESRLMEKSDVLEHLACGHVNFRSEFERIGKLACPKCEKELRQIGVDYKRTGSGYRCKNRHLFQDPKIAFVCAGCSEKFEISEARLETQNQFTLTENAELH